MQTFTKPTHLMRQIEATPEKPFYSVGYQYERNPYTVWSFTQWFEFIPDHRKWTGQGTSEKQIAIDAANWLVTQPGIKFAWVHVCTDCYNHPEVYKAEAKQLSARAKLNWQFNKADNDILRVKKTKH